MRDNRKGEGYVKKTNGEGKGKPQVSKSKKCGCEFLLLLKKDRNIDGWRVTVKNRFHNHSLNKSSMGHSFMGRLREDEKELMRSLTKSGAKPKVILEEFKKLNPYNCTPPQTLYNERVKLKKELRENRTVVQEVYYQARNSNAFIRYTCKKDVIENIFWAHKDSLLLSKNFPHILMIDCTYKTNFYKLPLLQVVGVTSTNLTFSIAFAYLGAEKIENYEWALRQLRDALINNDKPPEVIVTDRELNLMDAVKTVYPEAKNLLCRWHIEKAVKAKAKPRLTEDQCDIIIDQWKNLVYNNNEEEYAHAVDECRNSFAVNLFNYIESVWLSPHKERFVAAWTYKLFHLGNTHTSRAEGAHAALKNWLDTSNCDMAIGWNAIASLCEQQKHNIIASFEISRVKWPVELNGERCCCYLCSFMSLHGLKLIKNEMHMVKLVGVDAIQCGCVLRQTHGLPCAHEIASIFRTRDSLPRNCVHDHWKTLSMDGPLQDDIVDLSPHVHEFLQVFKASTVTQQYETIQRLREAMEPGVTTLSQPSVKINPRGRPGNNTKKRLKNDERYTKRMPSLFEHVDMAAEEEECKKRKLKSKLDVMSSKKKKMVVSNKVMDANLPYVLEHFREFVEDVINVVSDGNYGYRAVAMSLGLSEDEWPKIRQDLFHELKSDMIHYDIMFKAKGDCT